MHLIVFPPPTLCYKAAANLDNASSSRYIKIFSYRGQSVSPLLSNTPKYDSLFFLFLFSLIQKDILNYGSLKITWPWAQHDSRCHHWIFPLSFVSSHLFKHLLYLSHRYSSNFLLTTTTTSSSSSSYLLHSVGTCSTVPHLLQCECLFYVGSDSGQCVPSLKG